MHRYHALLQQDDGSATFLIHSLLGGQRGGETDPQGAILKSDKPGTIANSYICAARPLRPIIPTHSNCLSLAFFFS